MKKNLIMILFGLAFTTCTDLNLYSDDAIFISKGDYQLKITNQGDETIYYFIVEQNTAALLDWAPSVNTPNILSKKTVTIKYSEIFGLENSTIRNNTKAIFYYWFVADSNAFDVKNIIIDL